MKVYLSRKVDYQLKKFLHLRDRVLLPRIIPQLNPIFQNPKSSFFWGEIPEVMMILYGEESSKKPVVRGSAFSGYNDLSIWTEMPYKKTLNLLMMLKGLFIDENLLKAQGYHSVGKLHTHHFCRKKFGCEINPHDYIDREPSIKCFTDVDLGNRHRRLKNLDSKNPIDVVYCERPGHYSATDLDGKFLEVILF